MESLLTYDPYLYHLINHEWANPVFDLLLPFWREKLSWVPLYVLLIVFIWYRYRAKSWVYFIGVAVLMGIADYSSAELMKKQIQRPRPCRAVDLPEPPRMLVGCGGGYSFPSTHATNHFALAVFLLLSVGQIMLHWRWLFILWAFGVAYAQVYVGVHYPLDVAGGAMWGSLLAWMVWRLYRLLPAQWQIPFHQS